MKFLALKAAAQQLRQHTLTVYYAARDPRTPLLVRVLALLVAAYALSPIDLVPDFIPVLGYLDDLVILPLGIMAVVNLLPPGILDEHRKAAALAAEQPISKTAAAVVALIWVASMGLAGWAGYRYLTG